MQNIFILCKMENLAGKRTNSLKIGAEGRDRREKIPRKGRKWRVREAPSMNKTAYTYNKKTKSSRAAAAGHIRRIRPGLQCRCNKTGPSRLAEPCSLLEAPSGFGPEHKGFADLRLTTWLWRLIKWSGRRGSDSRPPPWQGGALPTELLPHPGKVPWGGIEPPTL